ncbi:MAG: lipoprotein [Gammaproteobacteria bacterium]|nr:lipoprotein [Gammaproteobacteria bacterium]MDH3430967.1 lipoprotein [Gammaproteobacteria bacterium]MDH3432642.1 lipoprotein [Gammaproteobacteria bacterium]
MKSIICTLVALLLVVGLSGCGQSGPLFVPGDPSSIEVQPKTQASDEEQDENEAKSEEDDRQ